ncbi:MAG: hypothetical protein WBL07_02820, partial [Thiothrix litoralis]|uniref:hypothetical protein n=1 Tax=Thiothrix litoralis TaxID=2891210 RepID=UPI003C73501C
IAYRESIKPPPRIDPDPTPDPIDPKPPILPPVPPLPLPPTAVTKTRFYGSVMIDPLTAKMKFAQIMDEVVEQFTTRTGVKVAISIEIEASSATGFDEALQRAIKENCNVLKFASEEFDEK